VIILVNLLDAHYLFLGSRIFQARSNFLYIVSEVQFMLLYDMSLIPMLSITLEIIL
jgi:hypothetical protein